MHTGQLNPQSIKEENFSGWILLNCASNNCDFPALNVSNIFATIDYIAHINTNIDYTINHVFRSMAVQELDTLHDVCELERNQVLTKIAMSVQHPQLAGFLLTWKHSNFLNVEGSTAWLYDCPNFLSLYRIPIQRHSYVCRPNDKTNIWVCYSYKHLTIILEKLLNWTHILTIKTLLSRTRTD